MLKAALIQRAELSSLHCVGYLTFWWTPWRAHAICVAENYISQVPLSNRFGQWIVLVEDWRAGWTRLFLLFLLHMRLLVLAAFVCLLVYAISAPGGQPYPVFPVLVSAADLSPNSFHFWLWLHCILPMSALEVVAAFCSCYYLSCLTILHLAFYLALSSPV